MGLLCERFRQFVDELVQIEIAGLQLLHAGEGEYDIYDLQECYEGGERVSIFFEMIS